MPGMRVSSDAIVRSVPEPVEAGIDSADLGKPDYEKAREQLRLVGRDS